MRPISFALLPLILVGCAGTARISAGPDRAIETFTFEDHDRVRAKVDSNTGMRVYSVVPDLEESKLATKRAEGTLHPHLQAELVAADPGPLEQRPAESVF